MPITRLEPELETASALGLTKQECQSVEREALRLMVHGRAVCVVQECDEGRRAHRWALPSYYVFDSDRKPLVVGRDFGRVLEMVKTLG